jgi:F-type H+-transporting ATPase subunit b
MHRRNGALLALGVALLPAPAMAAGDTSWATIAFHALNLGILLAIIVKLGKGPYMRFLNSRADDVESGIKEAGKLNEEAKARLAEFEEKLASLESRKTELIEEFKKEGEAEKARLIAEGETEAARIKAEAEKTAESEAARARARLQTELVDNAISVAMAAVSEKITPADRRRLAAEYLTRLEETARG